MAYLYEEEAARLKASLESKSEAQLEALKAKLEKKISRQAEKQREVVAALRSEISTQAGAKAKAVEKLMAKEAKVEVLTARLKMAEELNSANVEAIADFIRKGMTLRGACRLAKVPYARVLKWRAESKAPGAQPILRELDAAIEEALGEQEEELVGIARAAAKDVVFTDPRTGHKTLARKGDGKIAIALLERQHPMDYSPKQIIQHEEKLPEVDMSGYTDEEFAAIGAAEAAHEAARLRAETQRIRSLQAPAEEKAVDTEGEEVASSEA